jgi:hypothetical protein
MTKRQAYDQLPADAKWSSSFGYPGEGGFCEYYRDGNGKRYMIENGSWSSDGSEWTMKEIAQ